MCLWLISCHQEGRIALSLPPSLSFAPFLPCCPSVCLSICSVPLPMAVPLSLSVYTFIHPSGFTFQLPVFWSFLSFPLVSRSILLSASHLWDVGDTGGSTLFMSVMWHHTADDEARSWLTDCGRMNFKGQSLLLLKTSIWYQILNRSKPFSKVYLKKI